MSWRSFRKWAGFPVLEDVSICSVCGTRLTLGEWPIYPWICPKGPHI